MKISSQELLFDLRERTKKIVDTIESDFLINPEDILNWKANSEEWSVLECLEHLNKFGDFYLKEIAKTIKNGKADLRKQDFKSGIFGNWVAESMLVKEGKIKKMKTAKSKNPVYSKLPDNVMERFLVQQNKLIELIKKSENRNLTKLKVSTDIASFIKLRLGDILRFVVYHNERHLIQAKKVLDEINTTA
jgi:hypothetical protein